MTATERQAARRRRQNEAEAELAKLREGVGKLLWETETLYAIIYRPETSGDRGVRIAQRWDSLLKVLHATAFAALPGMTPESLAQLYPMSTLASRRHWHGGVLTRMDSGTVDLKLVGQQRRDYVLQAQGHAHYLLRVVLALDQLRDRLADQPDLQADAAKAREDIQTVHGLIDAKLRLAERPPEARKRG